MFKRAAGKLAQVAEVGFFFDGMAMTARAGDSVAAALLANGVGVVRHTPQRGSARGPYCMMGVCFDCLVTIDDAVNQQSCMIPVTQGMAVRTQARPMPFAAGADKDVHADAAARPPSNDGDTLAAPLGGGDGKP
ncbi:MAG TPA: (2Fe-2S)-binding protein [Bordetella sp.]|nr:(2Fe-2S)-binding protein [Bordetella sp.]